MPKGQGGNKVEKEQYTDQQLVELVERRSPHHQKMIDRATLQAFLDGHLVLRDGVKPGEGKIFETAELVELMIKTGFHKATDSGRGMKASVYRKMWPRIVVQPVSYAGRFDALLLVDRTLVIPAFVAMANFYLGVRPEDCRDLVPAPAPVRYIAFAQLGKKNLGRTVADCRASFDPDEVGLVTMEGLHLPIQHESYLRSYAVDLPGSACDGAFAPYVSWFGYDRPYFNANDIQYPLSRCGSASRGSEVIVLP